MIPKMWKDFELYTFPYLKNQKLGLQIIKLISNQREGYNQMFHVLEAFFSGQETIFPTNHDSESPVEILHKRVRGLGTQKVEIVRSIIDKIHNLGEGMISFKNFENLVLHSLRPENYTLVIPSKSLCKLLRLLYDKSEECTLMKPLE